MNENDPAMIPYFVHEGDMSRMERNNKRMWIIIFVLIVALVGSNIGWLIYESQFAEEVVTETYTATADNESNAILNGEGNVTVYGGNSGLHADSAQEGAQK